MSWYLLNKRFYLHFPDDKSEHLFIFLAILGIFFVTSLQVFSPFLNLFMFLTVIARVLCVFSGYDPLVTYMYIYVYVYSKSFFFFFSFSGFLFT